MGLDQYLYARKYVSKYDYNRNTHERSISDEYASLANTFNADFLNGAEQHGNASVSFTVLYWRKANQIHQWFVDNVQEGNDNCGTYYVSREALQELHELCQAVAISHDAETAEEELPNQVGFFFGSQTYDEWYFEQVAHTAKELARLLAEVPEDWDFYYSSSW